MGGISDVMSKRISWKMRKTQKKEFLDFFRDSWKKIPDEMLEKNREGIPKELPERFSEVIGRSTNGGIPGEITKRISEDFSTIPYKFLD